MRDIERICHAVALLKYLASPLDDYRFHGDARDGEFDAPFEEIIGDVWLEPRDRAVADRLYRDPGTRGACYVLTAVAEHLAVANRRCRAARLGPAVVTLELRDEASGRDAVWLTGNKPPPLSLDVDILMGEPFPAEDAPGPDWDAEARAATLAVERHYRVWRRHLRRYVRRTLRRWGWDAADARRWTRSWFLPLDEAAPDQADGGAARSRPPGGRHWRTVLAVLASARTSMSCPQIAAATAVPGGADISHTTVKNTIKPLWADGLVDGEGNNPKGPYLINRRGHEWLRKDAAARGERPAGESGAGNPGHA